MTSPGPNHRPGGPLATLLLLAALPFCAKGVVLGLFAAGVVWSGITRLSGGIHAAWLAHGLTDAGLLTWGLFYLGYLES
ncbi:MAG: hypothetical protein ACC645_23610 [Pirellulales bacterium]